MTVMGSFISLRGTAFGNHHTLYPFNILEHVLFFRTAVRKNEIQRRSKLHRNPTDSFRGDINFFDRLWYRCQSTAKLT